MSDTSRSNEDLIARAKALLAEGKVSVESRPAELARRREVTGYEEAAAVLGWFDPDTLQPSTDDTHEHDLGRLADAAIPVIDDTGAPKLSIGSTRRIEVLTHLRLHDRLAGALAANRLQDGDLLGRLIRDYAAGDDADLGQMSLSTLHSAALVCDWLRRAGFTEIPSRATVEQQIRLLELLEPFEILVGSDFVGRKTELARLRAFATGKQQGAGRHGFASVSEDEDARMLVIYGPGGIGKSTLIAKILLELADRDIPPEQRLLFAYLDFDRPVLDASKDAFPLLGEILTQLAVQLPQAEKACQNIRNAWAWRLERPPAERVAATRFAVGEVATLLASLAQGSRGLVLVLDTFEVVQRRSSEEVATILRMVDLLVANEELPNLRVVLAGRAGIPRSYADHLELAGLDPRSAKELLKHLGVKDGKLADRIVRRYGGDPVALKLAAADPDARGPLSDLVSRTTDWLRQLDAAVIQRRLYERVLGHLENPDVRSLAESGLVLRRLTPDIVLGVLAKPCNLRLSTYDDALQLFEALERETSLVQLDDDGALLYRPELRRLTLPLLEADRPELARELHRATIAYYAARPPVPRERAEEIYHRLKSGEDTERVAKRWLGGVEPYLASAMDELDGKRRAFLAPRIGVTVDTFAVDEAATADYEKITARKVRAMLYDDRPKDALTVLSARSDRSPQSPLVPLTAEAYFALGQVDQALTILDDAASETLPAGLSDQTYRLTRLQAELMVSAGVWRDANAVAARLLRLDELATAPLVRLGCAALAALMTERTDPSESARLRALTRERFDSLSSEALASDPALVRLVGSLHVGEEGADDAGRVSRVVRLAGLPRQLQGPVRVVAAELASLDASHEESPGMLSRRYGLRPSRSLTAAWSAFLLGADEADVRSAVCDVLDLPRAHLKPLVTALARLLGTDPALRRPSGPYAGPSPEVISRVTLSPHDRELLTDALRDIFKPDSLRWFLRLRLHQSLDALAPEAADFRSSVDQLVSALEERGLLLELVARCREVEPGDPRLLRVAEAVGLVTPLPGDIDAIDGRLRTAGLEPTSWQGTFGELEGQVCLVAAGAESSATGFLVGPDLVLTAASLVEHEPAERLRCRFDAKVTRDGDVVTPGTWYDVHGAAATGGPAGRLADWVLLRVDGSPGVQPIGGERVESATGTLRGWVDLSSTYLDEIPDRLLRLSHDEDGASRLMLGTAVDTTSDEGRYFHHDLTSSAGAAGAPLFAPDLTPFGLELGAGRDPHEGGTGIRLTAVLDDLRKASLDHLVRIALA